MRKVIAVLMILFILLGQAIPAGAISSSDAKKQIQQNKEKINDLQKEKQGIQSSKKTVQQELDELAAQITSRLQEIQVVQQEIDKINSEIAVYQQEINNIKTSIGNLTKDIEATEQSIKEQEEKKAAIEDRLSLRLRSLYKSDYQDRIIALLLNSGSLGDFIAGITAINKIVEIDHSLMDELDDIKNNLLSEQEQLGIEKKRLEDQTSQLYTKQDSYKVVLASQQEKKSQLDAAMAEVKALEDEEKSKYNELNKTEKNLNNKIDTLDNINEELQEELDMLLSSLNKGNSGSSKKESFIRPASGRITSEFGYRIHPIYKYKKFHYGIDIANSTGTPLKASKSGTVSYSGWMSGYGNVVILNHGNNEQTVYAHANKLKVSKGQKVSQGQTIATMGSTGNSTGPHLHFEIRINGVKTNPRKYINF